VESIGGGDTTDGLVQNIYMRIINRNRRWHASTLAGGMNLCPIAIFDRRNKAKREVVFPRVAFATYPSNSRGYQNVQAVAVPQNNGLATRGHKLIIINELQACWRSVRNLHYQAYPLWLADPGEQMTNVTVNQAVTRKPRRTMLYLLIVLFVISYSLLTRMVIEQTRTINSQRSLIHLLFKDNQHYIATLKARVHGAESIESKTNPGFQGMSQGFSSQNGSKKIPLIQVQPDKVQPDQIRPNQGQVPTEKVTSEEQIPSIQVPSDKAKSRTNAKSERKAGKAGKQHAMRPPLEMTDPSDMRRVSSAI
jgi:hypothetical protein